MSVELKYNTETDFLTQTVGFKRRESYVNVFTYRLPVSLRQQVCVGSGCNLKTKQKHEELFEIIRSNTPLNGRYKHNAKIHRCELSLDAATSLFSYNR